MNVLSPLSRAFPELFRRRGGPVLEVLLEAVDAEWLASAHLWSHMAWPAANDLTQLDAVARATGWGHMLDKVGGVGQVRRPIMLLRLLQLSPLSWDEQCRFWARCLFDLTVLQIDVRRGSSPTSPARACVVLSGAPPASSGMDVVFRILARIIPAHLAFAPGDLSIVPAEPMCPAPQHVLERSPASECGSH